MENSDQEDAQKHKEADQGVIIYHYLEFETDLPHPTSTGVGTGDHALEPPDLSQFQSPFTWPTPRKNIMICLSCAAAVLSAYNAGSYASGVAQMEAEWHVSEVAVLAGITIFTIGFGIAPMALASLSEINGRRPVFLVTGILFVILQLCCGVTPTFAGMLISRFLVGCASSTFSTMVGGIVADIYHKEDRNTPMAFFTGSTMFGTGLGPLVSGFIAQHTSWRWIFYSHTVAIGLLMVLLFVFFKETRGSVLLSRKAQALNEWYQVREDAGYLGFDMLVNGNGERPKTQRIRWKVKSDEERTSLQVMITTSLYRPFHMLFTEPIVFFFSLWISFSWAVLFCTFSAVPYIFSTVYGFSLEQSGAVFATSSIASILMVLVTIYQEELAMKSGKLSSSPEARLTFACFESAALPIGLFWLGWTSYPSIPWIVPTLAVGCATVGIFSIYLAVFNYLADCYHRYASSAIAAQSFCRNIMGGAFPLFTTRMYVTLGIGGASSLLGGIAAVLTLVPWVLVLMGPKIRAKSKIASQLVHRARQ